MAPPPPALPEELVEQILLRFRSDDPASLVRAALVCRPWCRLVAGPSFRQFHRTPPVLGFLRNVGDARFVPTSSFRPRRADWGGWRAIDARHGRVLLHRWISAHFFASASFAIWDPNHPITGERVELPILQELNRFSTWEAAVLCARGDACNHLDCGHGHFQVVAVSGTHKHVHTFVYSAEAGAWHRPNSHLHPNVSFNMKVPSALVENAIYFVLGWGTDLLMYNLVTHEMSVIDLPPGFYGKHIVLTTTEDGRLGCIAIQDSILYLW